MNPISNPPSTHRFPINLRHLALVLISSAGVGWWCQRGPAPGGASEPVGVTSRQVADGYSGPDEPRDTRSSRQRQPVAAAATGSAVVPLADGFRRAGGGSVAPEVLAGLRGSKRGDAVAVSLPGLRLSGGVDSVLDEGGVWHVGIEVADGRGRMVVSGRDDGLLTATVNLYGEEPGLKLANTLADPQVRIEELPYCKMVCAEPGTRYPAKPAAEGAPFAPPVGGGEGMPRNGPPGPVVELQGLPGAVAVLYLDLDGETVVHPKWNGGNPITCAAHARHTDVAWVTRVWQRVCEDFAPFAINVTTERAVYDAAPANKRVMCVATPSQAWLGNATPLGGMAFIGDFPFGTPCFAFNADEYSCAETISHEAGHTLGLHHDGRRTPPEAYYAGHGTGPTAWAPIMGAGYLSTPFRNVTQWCCGEYPESDNQEDDLSLIASAINAFGYRLDDKGNTKEGASPLGVAGTTVGDAGIIERPSDVDWLRFTAGAGAVSLTVAPLNLNSADTTGANLAVKLRLYDANGSLLQEADDPSGLAATLTRTVGTGTYYLAVEGAARGTAATGFTKYGSLGQYTVSGTLPTVVSDPVPPTVVITSPGGGSTDVPSLTVAGTADDNVAVAAVEVRLNGGGWAAAAGTQSWSLAVTLAAGANLIEARARDTAGNLSATATRTITYAASAPNLVVEQPAGRALTSGVSSVSFGSRAVGLAHTKTFKLRNAGTAPVAGLSMTLVGPDPEDYSAGTLTATSLEPGASVEVSVSFAAGTEGMRSAILQVASNDPLRNPFQIGLSGTGRPTPGTQYLWMTLAGKPGGSGTVDSTGSAAGFDRPEGIAVDGSGNLYVSDTYNHTIRKVTPEGLVTTLAGGPELEGSVDATGGAARFSFPRGLAIDTSGNLWVADSGNHTIRKVTPLGVVTTLAGAPGQAGSTDGLRSGARFNSPWGMAVDGSGNIYVSDWGSHTIRQVTASGEVTTLAGSPGQSGSVDGMGNTARFNSPGGVAADGHGNLYIADSGNHAIRKVTTTGAVTTLAGSPGNLGGTDGAAGAARFFEPDGIVVAGSGVIFVADRGNHTIRQVTALGVVTTLAGRAGLIGSLDGTGNAARFFNPNGIAADYTGNLFVTDRWNHTIRKVTAAGAVTTLAGKPEQRGSADGAGDTARFSYPNGVAVDGSGDLLIADTVNHTIRKVTAAGAVTTLAGSPGQSGSLDGTGGGARFSFPCGIAVAQDGSIYVADTGNNTIRRVSTVGLVTTLAGTPGAGGSADGIGSAARFAGPVGIAVDASGNLHVADSRNHTIRRVTTAGGVTTLAGSPGLVGSVDGTGEAARFNVPVGTAIDGGGNLYVADGANHTLRKVTPAGVVTTLAGTPGQIGSLDRIGNAARFHNPAGIAADGEGNLYETDYGGHTIRKVTPSGLVTTIGGTGEQAAGSDGIGSAARFSGPIGVAVTATGLVYVADTRNNRIVVGTPLPAEGVGAPTPPLTAWRVDRFGTSNDSGVAADAADPDGDGRNNLLEFAINGNPHVSDPALRPVLGRTGNLMRLTYTRRSDALDAGLSFAVEWSADLKADSWSTLGVSETILSDDGITQDVEATVAISGPRMFLRLRVSKEQD